MGEARPRFPAVGDVVAGRFRIVESISRGVWTSIFKAYQSDLDRFVALKVMHPDSTNDLTLVERFRREALFASQLTHPNTITTYDYGETGDGSFYIAMELLEGRDLLSVIRQTGAMDAERARRILVQVCRSLAEVHGLGMVHRDLKPDNIMLCKPPGGRGEVLDFVKVLDFGIAKATQALGDNVDILTRLTRTGRVVGTPLYMSPEQLMEEPASPASDVYALGHILYEMLTGRAAFDVDGANSIETMMRHLEQNVPDLPAPLNTHALQNIVRRATRKKAEDRFRSAGELLQALEGTLEASQPVSGPSSVWTTGEHQAASLARLPPPTLGPALPGRLHEIAWLNEHIRQVRDHQHSRILLLEGPTGIGKTALLDAALQGLEGRGREAAFVLSRHHHHARDIREGGLWADVCILLGLEDAGERSLSIHLREALRGYSAIHESQITVLLRLLRRDPELHATLRELKGHRQRLFDALSKPFVGLARRQLFVWALEDLEDEDPLSLAFLDYLREHFLDSACRMLILGTYNREEVAHGSGGARMLRPILNAGPPDVFELRLRGLAEGASAEALARVLDAPVGAELASSIRKVTHGHPQHMAEMLHQLQQQGALRRTNGVYQLRASAPANLVAPQLADVIGERLDAESNGSEAGARVVELLSALALLADDTHRDVCLKFARSNNMRALVGAFEQAVSDAVARGWLHERNLFLRFSVPLAREVVLKRLLEQAREEGHFGEQARTQLGAAGRFLLIQYPEPTGPELRQIVRRFVGANDRDAAIHCLRTAADVAYRSFNLETALDHYLRALRIGQERAVPYDDQALVVLLRLGEIHGTLGEIAPAEEYLRQAREIAESMPGSALRSKALGRALQLEGELASQRGDVQRAQERLLAAHAIFTETGDDHGVARVIVELANVRILLKQPESALDSLLEALVLAEVVGAVNVQTRAKLYLARARLQTGDLNHALNDANDALKLAELDQNVTNVAHAQLELGQILLLTGRVEEAIDVLAKASDGKARVRDRDGLHQVRLLRASALARVGRVRDARVDLGADLEANAQRQDTLANAFTALLMTDLDMLAADADIAGLDARLDEIERLGRTLPNPTLDMAAQLRRGALHLIHEGPIAASRLLDAQITAVPQGQLNPAILTMHALALARANHAEAADERLTFAFSHTARIPLDALLTVYLLGAQVARDLQRPHDAQALTERGYHISLRNRRPLEAAAFALLHEQLDPANTRGVALTLNVLTPPTAFQG